MQIPGSNLFSFAQTVFGDTELVWHKASERTLNSVGQYVTTYDDPVTIQGANWQPLARTLYEQYGLDLAKTYYLYYVPIDLADVQRDSVSDHVVLGSQTFQCESKDSNWFAIDGWMGMLCCLILNDPETKLKPVFNPSIVIPENSKQSVKDKFIKNKMECESFKNKEESFEINTFSNRNLKGAPKPKKLYPKGKTANKPHNAMGLFKNAR